MRLDMPPSCRLSLPSSGSWSVVGFLGWRLAPRTPEARKKNPNDFLQVQLYEGRLPSNGSGYIKLELGAGAHTFGIIMGRGL